MSLVAAKCALNESRACYGHGRMLWRGHVNERGGRATPELDTEMYDYVMALLGFFLFSIAVALRCWSPATLALDCLRGYVNCCSSTIAWHSFMCSPTVRDEIVGVVTDMRRPYAGSKTLSCSDFYEDQGRLNSAIGEYTRKKKAFR